ncbi:MAG: hypothetical protein FJ290_13835 [Planctomycetes bacterium]|nr:hypothetical protein [Planctomycetota bacterium]
MKQPARLLFLFATSALAAELPAGWELKGKCEADGGKLVASEPATLTLPTKPGESIELGLILGKLDEPLVLRATDAAKGIVELSLTAKDLPQSPWPWKKGVATDAGIAVLLRKVGEPPLFNDTYWIRPNPHFYHGADQKKALDNWDKLPAATQHTLCVRLDVSETALALWLDDRFIGKAELRAEKVVALLKPGHAVHGGAAAKLDASPRFVPIRLGGYRRAGDATVAKCPLNPGPQTRDGVPFYVAAPAESIDVGLSRWLEEATGPDDFTDDYYNRSAFDGTPESIILAVPTDDYSRAHILCTVDPDPARSPKIAFRLTRFLKDYLDSGGRGDAIAGTTVLFEGGAPGTLREVGVHLQSGQITDLLDEKGIVCGRSTQSLDLELTKALSQVTKLNHANYSTKPLGKPSAVRVFALTLERSIVRARLRSKQPGNVFYAADKPELMVDLKNLSAADIPVEVFCAVADLSGEVRSLPTQEVGLRAGRETSVSFDLTQPKFGWYRAIVGVAANGEDVRNIPTSFAILPPDTRKAGAESPFGTWWFRDSHIGTKNVADVAPLLQRLGFRHVCPGGSGPSGEELAKHGLSISMLPNLMRGKIADTEKAIDAAVKAHPEAKWALIFHEHGFGEPIVFPPEFIGQPVPKLNEKQEAQFKSLWDRAVETSKLYRAKYPQIKLIFGNSSLPFAVEFMRRGYPRDLVDAFGDEDLGQLIMPEYPPQSFKSIYWQQEYQKLYKYNVPVTTTYEWRGRPTTPGNLTEREQAELYARDCLHALAYRMPHINVALLHDVGDSYYYSRWGGTGLLHRWPLLNPKPSYVALATLTRELDGAKFTRYLTSNSPSLYLCEFQRGDEWVYALWLPRGEREVELAFDGDARYTLTDSMGNAREGKPRVSSLPIYLRAKARITKAVAGPATCGAPPAKLAVVDDLCDAGKWALAAERDDALEKAHFDFPRRQGKADVAVKDDAEKGKALEVRLLPQPDVPAPCPRYLILKPKQPVPVPGQPKAIGTWVKGNSSWGRLMWEIEDAKGERFFSVSAGEGGWMVGDWKARSYINFDGWNYLQVKLLTWYESGFYGPERCDWHYTAEGRVDFPIKLTRLAVELRDKVLHLTDLVPVPDPAIRLRDLSASDE